MCELHFPPVILVPQTNLLLQETATCSSRSCQFPTRGAENLAQGWTIWSYNPSLSWVVFVKSTDLLTWVRIGYRKKKYHAKCNLVAVAAKEKENKNLLICQILNLSFPWILFLLTELDFWLAVTAVIVPNRKAGVLAPHHHNIKNINSGLVTVQFPGVLLKMGRKKGSMSNMHS